MKLIDILEALIISACIFAGGFIAGQLNAPSEFQLRQARLDGLRDGARSVALKCGSIEGYFGRPAK